MSDTTAQEPDALPIEFTGSGAEYFRIWVVNVVLTLLTLGIYSAWAKVRTRAYFYGNTRLDGAGFEYLADPRKILLGRMIVGLFVLTYLAVTVLVPATEGLLGLAFLLLVPFLVVRSYRFTARNSAYGNLRFGFSATYWGAAMAHVIRPFIAAVALALPMAWAEYRRQQFVLESLAYGTTPFVANENRRERYKLYGATVSVYVLTLVMTISAIALDGGSGIGIGLAVTMLVLGIVAFVVVMRAGVTNAVWNAASLGTFRFRSELSGARLAWIYLTNAIAIVLTLGLYHSWARVRLARYRARCTHVVATGDRAQFAARAGADSDVDSTAEAASELFDFDLGI